MEKIPLRLSEETASQSSDQPSAYVQEKTPVAGYMAVGFGLIGVFGPAFIFTPLALLFSLIALLRGQAAWAFVGFLLVIGGVLSSPVLLGVIGLGTLYMSFDWQEMLQPVYQMFSDGRDV